MASDVRQGPLIVIPSFTIQPEWCDNLPQLILRTGWDGSGGDGGGGGGAGGDDSGGSTGGDTSGSAGSEGGAEGGGPGGTSGDAAGTAGSEGGTAGSEGGTAGSEGGATGAEGSQGATGDQGGDAFGSLGGVSSDTSGVDTSGVDASVAAALGDAGFSLGGLDATGAMAASVSDSLGLTGNTAADEAAAFNSAGLGGLGTVSAQGTEGAAPGMATGSPGAFASSLASQSDVASPAFESADEAPSTVATNVSDEQSMGVAPATTQSLASPDMSALAPSPQTSTTEEDMGPTTQGTITNSLDMGINAPTSQAAINADFADLSGLFGFTESTGGKGDFQGAPAAPSSVTAALEGTDQEDQTGQDQALGLMDAQAQEANDAAAALTANFGASNTGGKGDFGAFAAPAADLGLVADVDAQTANQNLGLAAQEMGVAGAPSGLGLTGGQATAANFGGPTAGAPSSLGGATGAFGSPSGTFGVTGDFSGGQFGGQGTTGNFGSPSGTFGVTGTFDQSSPTANTDVTNMDFSSPTFSDMSALVGGPTVSNTGGKGDFLGAPDAQSAALADTFGVAAPTQTADLGAPAPASPGVSTAGPTAAQGAPAPATDANQAANPSSLSSPSPAPAQDASVATALADLGLGTQTAPGSPGGTIPPSGGGTVPPPVTPAAPGPGGLPGDVQNQFQQANQDAITTMSSYFATLGLSGSPEEAQAMNNIQQQAIQMQSQLQAFFTTNPNASTAVQQSIYQSLLSNGGPALQNAVAQAAQRAGTG